MNTEAKILIVDDDSTVRETLRSCLIDEGYDLEFAVNGVQGLSKAALFIPDLILLDVMMPEMNGFEVCRHLRADPLLAQVPVILITGLDDHDSRVEGIGAGADDFISKPYDLVELRARVRTTTRLNRYRRLLEERMRRQEAESQVHELYQELQRHARTLELTVAERTNELRIERDHTHAILESLGEAVVVTDAQQTIQYVNPAFTALTGYEREEAIGQQVHWWRNIHHSANVFDRLVYVAYTGQVQASEIVGRRKNGTLYAAMLTIAPLFDQEHSDSESGRRNLAGFVGVSRDITPLKEADRLKDQFVSNVSHELRTPLSVITMAVGNLDLFYDRLDDSRRHEIIRDLRAQARLLNDLIGDILELSRIDSRREKVDYVQIDLAQLVRAEGEKQRALTDSKRHTLHIVGPDHLMVLGNEQQLGQVLRNLLNNAIKYTPEGGQITCEYQAVQGGALDSTQGADRPWPGLESLPAQAWAAVRVSDTGIGISPEHLPHIFERFYRVEPQGNISGTGLGLSIAKGLVELHHGYVGVASTPGKGSVFAFYLPMRHSSPHTQRSRDG